MNRAASAAVTRAGALRVADSWVLGAALLLGAGLRLLGLTRQGLWTDELYAVWEARQPLDVLFNPHLHIQHPPGYRLALHLWLGPGQGEAWVRLLPALAGVLLIAVVWALARALWPAQSAAASASALLAATAPFLLHYSQDVTTYSWTMLWVATSVLLLIYAWRSDRAGWWAAWAGSLVVAAYSHYFSLFPLLVEAGAVVGVVASHRRDRATIGRLRHAALAVVSAILLYVPWIVILITQGSDAIPMLFPLTLNDQPLRWMPLLLAGFGHPDIWQHTVGVLLAWAVLLPAGAWATWRLARRRDAGQWRVAALVLAWTGAGILGPYLFLRLTEPPTAWHSVNHAAEAVPPLLLGLGALVAAFPRPARVAALAAWLLLAGWQWRAEVLGPPQQDWRGLLGTVAAAARPGDALLAFPAFHAGAAAAYYPVPVPLSGGWFTAAGGDPTGAAYWFPPGWHWRGWLDPHAERSADWASQLATHTGAAARLWYLAGDGIDGTYPPSPAAERALRAAGWQPTQEWHASPLILRLYVRAAR